MNIEQFYEFLNTVNATILNPPVHPFRADWKRIYESIKPHFYGEVPTALDKAFPNEDEQILAYRKNTYQPKTESPLVKAITELHRLLSSAKHSVRFENTDMKEFAENQKFGESNLQNFVFSVFIPNRVLDPNAVLLIEPKGEGTETDNVRVNIDMKIIQSERIIFNDPEYRLLIYKGISKNKYSTLGIENPLYYHIVTDMFYAQARAYGDKTMFEVIYEHNSGIMPFVTLGGRVVPKYDSYGNTFKIYKSDFSPAIPYLNDAAIFDNQHKSVMLATCFPIKFVEGVDCNSCNGVGRVPDPNDYDTSITCKTCLGHGKTLSITPLAAYNLNPTTSKFGDSDKQTVEPIRYYSPDISTIQETNKVATEALGKAEQVLNINRSLKSAQSGVAKELDREPEYIEVGKISDDVYARYKEILRIIQAIVFMDTESPIMVNPPISFDLKTETELMAEFAASQKGLPTAIRYESYISYIDRRYNSDTVARQIATICAMYNSAYLYTVDERVQLLASGQITEKDAISAQFVFDAVTELYYDDGFDIMANDYAAIKTAIDLKLAPRFEAVASVEVPQIDLNQFNNTDTNEFNTVEANDIEAEAKANLKGSVGGVQGILQIQKSVTDGVTDYNAALAILDLIYGISIEDAKRILGTPKIIKPTA